MHFHVLGLGPIGCLISWYLRRVLPPKHTVTGIRKGPREALQTRREGNIKLELNGVAVAAHGLEYESFDPYDEVTYREYQRRGGRTHLVDSHLPSPLEDRIPIESLIVTTKAHTTVPAIEALRHRLSPNSTIVLLQNGMGTFERLSEKIFRNPEMRPHFVLTVNNHGAFMKDHMHVVHAGIGDLQLGIVPDALDRNFEAGMHNPEEESRKLQLNDISDPSSDSSAARYLSLRNTISALTSIEALNVSWKPIRDVQILMRRKVVVNSVINPLTGLLGCKNGEIFSEHYGKRVCYRVCQEASDAFHAEWKAEVAAYSGDPADLPPFPEILTAPSLVRDCMRVAAMTGENFSSMLSDVRRAKPTEIYHLNGYLLGLGRTYNVPMPATSMLFNFINMRTNIPLQHML